MALIDLANPTRFLGYSRKMLPFAWGGAAILLATGLYMGLFVAPAERYQGDTARIMYLHVPMAYYGMFTYAVMAVAALGTLVWRHPLADVTAKAAAPLGAAFTFLALVTGSLWGRPTWGTWWVWDGRLTSVLVLFIMYLGLIALWRTVEDPGRASRAAAVLILVGTVNLPIIHFSVNWWNTLHQGNSLLTTDGPKMAADFLAPLFINLAGFTFLFVALLLQAMRNEILRRRVRNMQLSAAGAAA